MCREVVPVMTWTINMAPSLKHVYCKLGFVWSERGIFLRTLFNITFGLENRISQHEAAGVILLEEKTTRWMNVLADTGLARQSPVVCNVLISNKKVNTSHLAIAVVEKSWPWNYYRSKNRFKGCFLFLIQEPRCWVVIALYKGWIIR